MSGGSTWARQEAEIARLRAELALERAEKAEAKLARVREMHREDREGYCELCCGEEHPCPTRRAIEGEQT